MLELSVLPSLKDLEADLLPSRRRNGVQNYPQAHSIGSREYGLGAALGNQASFPDDLPSVPVFDKTLPVKQMAAGGAGPF